MLVVSECVVSYVLGVSSICECVCVSCMLIGDSDVLNMVCVGVVCLWLVPLAAVCSVGVLGVAVF